MNHRNLFSLCAAACVCRLYCETCIFHEYQIFVIKYMRNFGIARILHQVWVLSPPQRITNNTFMLTAVLFKHPNSRGNDNWLPTALTSEDTSAYKHCLRRQRLDGRWAGPYQRPQVEFLQPDPLQMCKMAEIIMKPFSFSFKKFNSLLWCFAVWAYDSRQTISRG